MNPEWHRWRLANTASNAFAPIVAAFLFMLHPQSFWLFAFFFSMLFLGIASGLWHWYGKPYNEWDRLGMFLTLSVVACAGWPIEAILLVLVVTFFAFSVTILFNVSSLPIVGALAVAGVIRCFVSYWPDLATPASVGAVYLAVLWLATIDKRKGEPNRRGAVHTFWHLGAYTAIGATFHLILAA